MSDNFYTTKTAALKATKGDIRNLNAKQIKLNDKNILDYISDSEFNSYDSRDPQLKNDELDIWNTAISLSDNGHIEVKPHVHGVLADFDTGEITLEGITESQIETLRTAVNVIDNELLGENDEHIMYWQTDGLTDVYGMFSYCDNLTSFSSDLPSLTNGDLMFADCSNLTSFSSDLSSLTDSSQMFNYCENLSDFKSELSSLMDGQMMFFKCKLDAQSVANIVHTLPTRESNGYIYIGIGCDDTEADQLLFTQECDCDTWQELLDDFSAKNWTVTFQCNGRPAEAATYNLRRGATLPIYAKLVEVIMPTDENERKPHYAYTSQDGSKFYNINYFHSTNGSTEGYDVFSSLEEAISTYNVTPKN